MVAVRLAEPRPGTAGLLLGAALAPIFGVASLLRGERCVHPNGAAYDAVLTVADPASRLAYGCVLGVPGRHTAVVRLSRGLGYAPPRPDVHGLAIRLVDAGGPDRPQDLLLISAVARGGGYRIVKTPGVGPLYSSVLPVRLGTATAHLTAVPVGEPPSDADVLAGRAAGLRIALRGCVPGGPDVPLAELALAQPRSAEVCERLRFDMWNAGGDVQPVGILDAARRVVYPASQLGRRLRGA